MNIKVTEESNFQKNSFIYHISLHSCCFISGQSLKDSRLLTFAQSYEQPQLLKKSTGVQLGICLSYGVSVPGRKLKQNRVLVQINPQQYVTDSMKIKGLRRKKEKQRERKKRKGRM
jgi:hypothetical protein